MRIMVVDDYPAMREMMRTAVRQNFDVEAVFEYGDGKSALDAYLGDKIHPDLIITDFDMPIMNGQQFAEEVRKAGYKGILVLCSGMPEWCDNFEPFDDVVRKDGLFCWASNAENLKK